MKIAIHKESLNREIQPMCQEMIGELKMEEREKSIKEI